MASSPNDKLEIVAPAEGQTSTPSWLGRRLFQPGLRLIDKYRYAPLAAATTAGVTVAGAGAALCSALGIDGSTTQFLVLGIIGLATFAAVHSALLYRSKILLESAREPALVFEVRRKLDQLLPQLDPKIANEVQQIVANYHDEINRLQDSVTRLSYRDIPGKPVTVESGKFIMGSDDVDIDECSQHEVYVSAFLIEKYAVTNYQFLEFVNDKSNEEWLPQSMYERYGIPYYLSEWDGLIPPKDKWDCPVVSVSWFAAAAFCNWRSAQELRSQVYIFVDDYNVTTDFSQDGWRLPTEAEWEKAAGGGLSNLRYPWTGSLSPAHANYGKHRGGTTPVGQYPPNDFEIFDMLGNVKEWCNDFYSLNVDTDLKDGTMRDPQGPENGDTRVFRGGSWMDMPEWIHLSKRGKMFPRNTNPDFGFRCVRKP